MDPPTPAPLMKHCKNNGKRVRPRKDFLLAVSPYVARKVPHVSRETAELDLGRSAGVGALVVGILFINGSGNKVIRGSVRKSFW